jgi:hypothetical protein
MDDELENNLDEGKEATNETFENMEELKPPRKVATHDRDEARDDEFSGSLSDRMSKSPKMTDIQAAIKQLFPQLKTDWLTNLQVGRGYTDNYIFFRNIITKELLHEFTDISVAEALVQAEIALSVEQFGEGRLDLIALYGKVGEEEGEKEKGKGI